MTKLVPGPGEAAYRRVFFAISLAYAAIALALSLAAAYATRHNRFDILFELSFFVGPTAQSLLEHRGLTYTSALGPCTMVYHAARMPVASVVVALGALWLGIAQVYRTAQLKTVVLLLPVLASALLAFSSFRRSPRRLWAAAGVLLLPFLTVPFLADVVNLQVEEGYAYAFLALATALVLFDDGLRWPAWVKLLLMALDLDLLYLSKSSMVAAVAVLAVAYAFRLRGSPRRVLFLMLVLAAPLSWGLYQQHAAGRFTVGTSLDGANLHKGNNAAFLQNYPPQPLHNLDDDDIALARGAPCTNEWELNDWHERAAIDFLKSHPRADVRGWLTKAYVFFASLRTYGSGAYPIPAPISLLGMVIFRLLLWSAVGAALYAALRCSGAARFQAVVFLATVAAVSAPYMAGFGYTRHASVLIYPAALSLCGWLRMRGLGGQTQALTEI